MKVFNQRLKEVMLGTFLASTVVSAVAEAGQDDVIMQLALENARIKPEQAMAETVKQYPGYLDEFGIDDDDGRLVYELRVVSPETGRKTEIEMDAETGKILDVDDERISGWSKSDQSFSKMKYQQLVTGNVTLQSAVEEARKLSPGMLVEAELEQEKGVVFFEIELVGDQGWQKVIVDLNSGKPIPVTRRDYDRSKDRDRDHHRDHDRRKGHHD